jgi:phosphoribosylanthranilate isomerase
MGIVVKICGLKTQAALDVALAAGADMVGLVHFAESPRHLEFDAIAALIAHVDGRAETCVLLVDPAPKAIEAAAETGADWLQLHGREDLEAVREARAASRLRVMKALPVAEAGDLEAVAEYAAVADRLLLDARPPAGAGRPGGLGRAFDWSVLAAIDRPRPFMLAGGLTAGNVGAGIQATRPFGVDVSSGVESAPGIKDAGMIEAFVAAVRTAEAAERETTEA